MLKKCHSKNKMETVQICLLGIVCLLSFVLLVSYFKNTIAMRNEAEYRDIVEYQTMLLAAMIKQNAELVKSAGNLRYFPDSSGFFMVLDLDGKVVAHGDDEDENSFNLPISEILTVAKEGGGYVRYNYKGNVHDLFIYLYPGSKYIVCSGLFVDNQNITRRLSKWKRYDRTILKKSHSSGGKKRSKGVDVD